MIGVGNTLGLYIARRFAVSILAVFLTVFGLIYMIDLVELLRRASEGVRVSVVELAKLAFLRTPAVAEQVLPFAFLFGSIVAFLGLSRRMELVIARASGISVWQFGFPPLIIALLAGILTTTVYNPLSVRMKAHADQIESTVFSRAVQPESKGRFIRQVSVDGSSIIRAEQATNEGTSLSQVTAFVFDKTGLLLERVEAESGDLRPGFWDLKNVRILTVDIEPQISQRYLLATNLTAGEVRQVLGSIETIEFWNLPQTIRQLQAAGLDSSRHQLYLHGLLAKPIVLLAMVIIAACVSLRFFRFGGVAKLVLYGVIAGFVLYAALKVATDLASAGLIGIVSASWVPAVVGCILGISVLLKQEDG